MKKKRKIRIVNYDLPCELYQNYCKYNFPEDEVYIEKIKKNRRNWDEIEY
jgi:hypothetical protein